MQVCPTGIDIRNGLQYECINCGACVDACNGVMEKMNYPKGLISFTSEERLTGGTTHIVRPKLIGYLIVLLLMVGLLIADIATRTPLEVDLIRDRNSLYRENGKGNVENVYTIKILNKSQDTHTYTIQVEGLPDYNILGDTTVTVGGGEVFSMPISLETSPKNLSEAVTEISFRVRTQDAEGNVVEVNEPTKFLYR